MLDFLILSAYQMSHGMAARAYHVALLPSVTLSCPLYCRTQRRALLRALGLVRACVAHSSTLSIVLGPQHLPWRWYRQRQRGIQTKSCVPRDGHPGRMSWIECFQWSLLPCGALVLSQVTCIIMFGACTALLTCQHYPVRGIQYSRFFGRSRAIRVLLWRNWR